MNTLKQDPMPNPSARKNNPFPVRQREEHRLNRRQFAVFAGLSTLALAGLASWKGTHSFHSLWEPKWTDPIRVGPLDQWPVGTSRLISLPSSPRTALVVRVDPEKVIAFQQQCTHLLCPVQYRHEQQQFYCPCHHGVFSAETGEPLAGPPRKPLPAYPVRIYDGVVWLTPSPVSRKPASQVKEPSPEE